MAKMNFDFKQFMLQKGEKVGLWTCVGLGVLMLGYSLFMPGKGFLSGSPNSNALALEELSKKKENQISNARPTGELPEQVIDPRLRGPVKPVPSLVAANYSLPNAFYTDSGINDGRRNEPNVLPPDPSSISATPLLAQLSTYKFIDKGEKIGIITPPVLSEKKKARDAKNRKGLGGPGGGFPGGGFPGGGFPGGMAPGGMGMGGMPGGAGGMGRGASGGGGMPPGMGMAGGGMPPGMGGFGMRGGGMGFQGGMPPGFANKPIPGPKSDNIVTFIKIDELEKHQNAVIAEEVLPTRAIEFVAAFPLREQYKEVQRALHLASLADAYNEIKFDGFDVERRLLLSDGKTPAPGADWVAVDVQQKYKWLFGHGGRRVEPEDPELVPLLKPWSVGLTMNRLAQQETLHEGAKDAQKVSRYPNVELKLPQITKALEELKKAGQQEVPHGPKITDTGDVDPYSASGTDVLVGQQMMNPENIMGKANQANRLPGAVGASGNIGEFAKGEKSSSAQKFEVPEFALIRFFDFNVEPGSTYEYRFRVRMKNPNKDRTDVAYPELAEKKVLTSPWVSVPNPKPLPEEVQYYAIDLKNVDWKYKDKEGNEKPVAGLFRGAAQVDSDRNSAVIHIQRWLNEANLSGNPEKPVPATVGDWVMGQRLIVYRGEYVGHLARQKVVIWSTTDEDFILAANPTRRGSDKSIIDISFAAEGAPEDAILVDFGGGRMSYKRITALPKDEDEKPETKTVTDVAPPELLIMTPDGRLVVRDSAADTENTDARDRYVKWVERIQDVENKATKDAGKGGKGGDAFGPGGKGGGGGGGG